MSYYRRHVFFCCNKRDPPEACCANHGSPEMQAYAKARIKALGENGKGKVRINKSGCLDRCEEGPVLVVYPEAWHGWDLLYLAPYKDRVKALVFDFLRQHSQ